MHLPGDLPIRTAFEFVREKMPKTYQYSRDSRDCDLSGSRPIGSLPDSFVAGIRCRYSLPVFVGFATNNKPYRKAERAKRFGCDIGTQPAERLGDFCYDFEPARSVPLSCRCTTQLAQIRSHKNLSNHMTVNVGQPSINTVVCERKLRMIQSKQMQDRRIEIVNRQDVLNRFKAKFIGHTMTDTAFDTSSREHGREAVRIVISPKCTFLEHGHTTEFCAPDNQRIFQ